MTTLVAAAGLAGLLLRGLPDRRWLLGGVLLGTVLVAAAHTGVLTGPLASTLQSALDGRLAPLRNVHKADPVLRLPLVLGVAHLLAVASRAAGRVGRPVPARFAAAAAVPVVAGLVAVHSVAGMGQRAGAAGHVRGHPGVLAAGRGLARPARRRRADAAAAVARTRRSTGGVRRGTSRCRRWRPRPGRSATAPRSARRAAPGCSTAWTPGWPPASRRPRTPTCWPGPASGSCCCATTSTRTGPGPSGRR